MTESPMPTIGREDPLPIMIESVPKYSRMSINILGLHVM